MKRLLAVCILICMLIASGCGNEKSVKTSNNDNTPAIIGEVEYIKSVSTTHSDNTIKFEISGNELLINADFDADTYRRIMVVFNGDTEGCTSIDSTDGSFEGSVSLPDDENTVIADLYGGAEQYGTFESIVMDCIKLVKDGDDWSIAGSPVYDSNKVIFEEAKNTEDSLEATESIQSDDAQIIALANEITSGISDDYDKVRALHDWVCKNIYYDIDALSTGDYDNMDALGVLESKRGVCEGYANIMAALVRSLDIPCRVQGGYALGISTDRQWSEENINVSEGNHAWNEVYVDGRWIIIDATWDSQNEYKNGTYVTGNTIKNIYFDSTLEFFSFTHKLMNL